MMPIDEKKLREWLERKINEWKAKAELKRKGNQDISSEILEVHADSYNEIIKKLDAGDFDETKS
jgi:hypothetical protein